MPLRLLFCLVGSVVLVSFTAWNCAAEGDCDKAKEAYRRGTQLMSFEARRAAFAEAVKLCPTYAAAHINLADALENLALMRKQLNESSLSVVNSLLDQAAREYARAVELDRGLGVGHVGLGEVYLRQGRWEPAVDQFKRALELRSDDRRAMNGLRFAQRKASENQERFRTSDEIRAQASASTDEAELKTMGFRDYTVSGRQAFHNILFEGYSSQVLSGDPTRQLDEIGKAISSPELEKFSFVIEGHASQVDSFEINMRLSLDRARAVKSYLVEKFRIPPDRLIVQGFGYTRPRVFPENEAKNRRVEIIFNRAGSRSETE